jgi:hypothetical protein
LVRYNVFGVTDVFDVRTETSEVEEFGETDGRDEEIGVLQVERDKENGKYENTEGIERDGM